MAADLSASRTALEEAQRRTAAVLRNVASGVIAVDSDARGDARESAGGCAARASRCRPARRSSASRTARSRERVRAFLANERGNDEEEFDLELRGRQIHGRLARLGRRRGAVLTLDDVTELARAQRVLAWGEMARQVAHEIKNPLTPIRLGVQHLKRAHRDGRVDLRARARSERRAHPRRDRPARRDRARVQPLRNGARRASAGDADRRRGHRARRRRARAHGRGRRRLARRAAPDDRADRDRRAATSCARCCSTCSRTRASRTRATSTSTSSASTDRVRDRRRRRRRRDSRRGVAEDLRAALLHAHERQWTRARDQSQPGRRVGWRDHGVERARTRRTRVVDRAGSSAAGHSILRGWP